MFLKNRNLTGDLEISPIFKVKNTTLSTTRVIFPYTAQILNVLVYSYRFYRAIHRFSDIFWEVYEADQSTKPTKFYNGNTTPVIFPIYSTCMNNWYWSTIVEKFHASRISNLKSTGVQYNILLYSTGTTPSG